MALHFLSFSDEELSQEKITKELLPKINKFLFDAYNDKKSYTDGTPEDKKVTLSKIKLLVDIADIYANPSSLRMVKDYLEEKERERLRAIDAERKRREREMNNNSGIFGSGFFNYFNNNRRDDSEDEELTSNVSEEDHHQQEVNTMLEQSYINISERSSIGQMLEIKRTYLCEFEYDNKDNDDNEGTESKDDASNPETETPGQESSTQVSQIPEISDQGQEPSSQESSTQVLPLVFPRENQPIPEISGQGPLVPGPLVPVQNSPAAI